MKLKCSYFIKINYDCNNDPPPNKSDSRILDNNAKVILALSWLFLAKTLLSALHQMI